MSDYDLTKNSSHPLGWSNDAKKRGEDERRTFGTGNESPQQPSESWADYQTRIHGRY